MTSAATKLVLLAIVTLWASGADLYLHERLDHQSAQLAVTGEHGRQPHCAGVRSIDAHGCLTCCMLAMMVAAGVSSPRILPTPQQTAIEQPIAADRAPHAIELSSPPARGPPALG
jgi:hypothetical protein